MTKEEVEEWVRLSGFKQGYSGLGYVHVVRPEDWDDSINNGPALFTWGPNHPEEVIPMQKVGDFNCDHDWPSPEEAFWVATQKTKGVDPIQIAHGFWRGAWVYRVWLEEKEVRVDTPLLQNMAETAFSYGEFGPLYDYLLEQEVEVVSG